ncbi:S-adenosyl-L-methionine-dependent methyltransferase [Colletotrichum godetiae]|uniref:S-adenosyl-L-methionine-dependent methyltransferase n=1 Tax=Colletotrichum godetiae TaxID=1209918 RepID=A0AAJ0AEX1_9PEZI|nr:S-adenosyl-L-methionine-dependent methyltransferase [Colletotrichum godetiae]KAK1659695.1 S-adenosyl-L-methionine-dependent methyltransferase [Colletotrichum godetiae]
MATSSQYAERTYHDTSSPYVLPNDAPEQTRLDEQALAIESILGGKPFLFNLRLLPIQSKILDIGCGTAVATTRLARQCPSSWAYGIDLSAVPDHVKASAPTNVTFLKDNIMNDLSEQGLQEQSLDYVFGRMLFLAIDDWKEYFSRVHHFLKPGAIVEHQDCSWEYYRQGTQTKLSGNWSWHQAVLEESQAMGLDILVGDHAGDHMKAAGLEFSMVPSEKNIPSAAVGYYAQRTLLKAFPDLLRKILTKRDLYSNEDVSKLTKKCLETSSVEEGIFVKYTVPIGRKPAQE